MNEHSKSSERKLTTRFFIRTQRFDAPARLLGERIAAAAGEPPIYICDDRLGSVDTGIFDQVNINERTLSKYGFAHPPPNWGWFCGDLFYHVAAQVDSSSEYLCLMDSDVYLDETAAADLVSFFEKDTSDAVAVDLKRYDTPPKYSRDLEKLDIDQNWGCIFPLTRVRRSLLAHMKNLRLRSEKLRLNDEAILAGAVISSGGSFCDLRAETAIFPITTFNTNPPHLFEAAVDGFASGVAIHPIVTFDTVISRINSGDKVYSRHRLRRVLKEATGRQRKNILRLLAFNP